MILQKIKIWFYVYKYICMYLISNDCEFNLKNLYSFIELLWISKNE